MLTFPDPNVETEYTDPNGSVWEFNGTGWVRQCDCPDGGTDPEPEPIEAGALYCASGTQSLTINHTDPSNSVFALGSGDFTVEVWVRSNSRQFGVINPPTNKHGTAWGLIVGNYGLLSWNDSWMLSNLWECSGNRLDDGVWHHVRVCRHNGKHIVYIDGFNKSAQCTGSLSDTANYTGSPEGWLGRGPENRVAPTSYADARIVRGVALSTGDRFEVPREPVRPSDDGDNLLCINFMDGEVPVDSSGSDNQLAFQKGSTTNADTPYNPAVWVLMPVYLDAEGQILEMDNDS